MHSAHPAVARSGAVSKNHHRYPWKDIETSSRFGVHTVACIKGIHHSVFGLNLYQIDVTSFVSALNYLENVYTQYPGFRDAILAMDMVSTTAVESVLDDATAYPYRNAIARMQVRRSLPPSTSPKWE